MEKKLLFVFFAFSLFFLNPLSGFGQCPTTLSISANPGIQICSGTQVTFSANITGGTGTLSYQWKLDGNNVGTGGTSYGPITPTNGQSIQVIVTSSDNANCSKTSSITMTVNPKRTGSVTIQASNTNICPGENVSFSISNVANAGSGATYIWKVNGTQVGTNSTSFSSNSLVNTDKVRLTIQSSVPCTAEFMSNEITINEKAGTPNTPGTISGTTEVCPGDSVNYSISNVANADSYNWTVPSGWGITSGQNTNSVTVTAGSSGQNGNIQVTATNSCGTSSAQTLTVTVKPGTPNTPGTVSGTTEVCPGDSVNYSISNVANADSYNWTVPSGWTINSGQNTNSISVSAGTAGQNGNVQVTATNSCGTSTAQNLGVTVNPGTPGTPGTISGNTDVCPGDSVNYSISNVVNVDSYNWTVPSGWTINSGQNTNSITVIAGTAGQNGNIQVAATNSCGTGAAQTLGVTVKPGTPGTPGTISGNATVCPSTSSINYTISAVANADSYTWNVPSGWSINSGQNTNSITVTSGGAGQNGNLSVTAGNSCGTSTAKTLAVTVQPGTPNTPATITGPTAVCNSATSLNYSVSAVANATQYDWTLPIGWQITAGTGTANITVSASSTSGNITVNAQNSCGISSAKSLAVITTNGVPSQPGTITSSLGNNPNVCPPLSGVTFSVTAVAGATGYNWILPTGFQITSGANTNSITVKINSSQTYISPVSVSVQATNLCGNSTSSTFSGIAIDNYILTDIGPDQTVCKTLSPITINGQVSFGNAKFKPTYSTSGGGSFPSAPSNNVSDNFSFNYQPVQADLNAGQVTITFSVPKPNGSGSSCGNGVDDMIIYFRNAPTANISAGTTICVGSSTDLTITGTANTTVTYKKGSGANQTINLGSGGSATINSGALNANTIFQLVSVIYNDTPICQATLSSSSTITVTPVPTASISYSNTPFCSSDNTAKNVTLTGTGAYTVGTYSASPSGLNIDTSTGNITPNTSNAGTYTITYTIPASGGCSTVDVTTQVTITKLPTSSISYSGTPFCQSISTTQAVTLTGTEAYTEGSFTSTAGLSINSPTGAITPSTSNPGSYTITYTTPAANGCGTTTSTTNIVITETPTPVITYAAAQFCSSETSPQNVTLTGSGNISGGVYSSTTGLDIVSSTGAITPSTSSPGNYVVTYTLSPAGGCQETTSTTNIEITQDPSAEISYNGTFCTSDTTPKDVTFANIIGTYQSGTFSVIPAGLTIDSSSGKITPSSSSPGSYTVTYSIPASAGCGSKDITTTIDIEEAPAATISYLDSPFCSSDITLKSVSFSDTVGAYENGTFSGTSGLIIDPTTGEINPNGSTTGNHRVTYTIPAGSGCNSISVTTEIEINEAPTINTQPYNVAVCTTNDAQLEVTASGDNLTYQWYKGTEPGSEISGATSAILSINQATTTDGGIYYVIVSGASSCSPIKSDEVTLNVDENIVVNTQPVSQDLCEGGTLNLSIDATATGGAPQYQWRKDGNPLTNGGNISGASSANLSINNLSTTDAGDYDVVIDGPDGYTCDVGYSQKATITVNPAPTADAGADFQACSTNTTITLKGNDATVSNNTSLEWTTSNGAGTISDPTSLDATYQPDASDYNKDLEFTLTAVFDINGNQPCSAAVATKKITIVPLPVINSFSYSTNEFCETDSADKSPTLTGDYFDTSAGNYTVEPTSGLILSASTGVITPNGSTPGEYVIKYTAPSNGVCTEAVTAKYNVTIGQKPVADFSYNGTPYCSNSGNVVPTFATGGVAGTFSATPDGLSINASTGEIDIANTTPGTYTVTNTIAAAGGCIEVEDTSEITITKLPVADFSYTGSPYCSNGTNPTVTLNSTLGSEAGTFSSTSGLVFANSSTGEIDIATSTPGTYTVTNTIAPAGGCIEVKATSEITITKLPVADFSYAGSPYCSDGTNPTVTLNSTLGSEAGTFSSTSGLDFANALTGEINIATSTPGTYTVTNTIAAAGGCIEVKATSEITITKLPVADFSYAGSPYCSDGTNPTVTLNSALGAQAGTFSSTTGLVFANTSTGEINIATSTPGTYTVTNTIAAANGCSIVTSTANITITKLPDATFTYTQNAYCVTDYSATVSAGYETGGSFSSATLGSLLNASTGVITWTDADMLNGNYDITYTFTAAGGCAAVSHSETITIDALPEGGSLSWSNDERIFLTCEIQTNNLNEVLKLEGHIGEIIEWEYRTASTLTWATYNSQNSTLTSSDFASILDSNVESTVFRAKIANGACIDGTYSQTAILSVIPSDIKPAPVEVSPDVLCYGAEISLSSSTGYGQEYGQFEGGAFDNAGIKNHDWRLTNPSGGSNDFSTKASNGRADHWLRMVESGGDDGKVYTANIPNPTSGSTIPWASKSISEGNKGFALVTGNNDSFMETPPFSLGSLDEAILTFDQAYNLTAGATIIVEISTNGGSSYEKVLFSLTGDGTTNIGSSGNYTSFGDGTPITRPKNKIVIDLGDYLGQTNLRVRFNYNGVIDGDVWAVDNIKVPEGPQDVLLQWFYDENATDPNNTLEQIGADNQEKVSFIPRKIGWNNFEVKTALLLDSNGDPCEDINNSETIRVFVFDQYTTNATAETGECGNTRVTLHASTAGAFQGPIDDYPTIDGYAGSWVINGPNNDFTLTNLDPLSTLDPVNNPDAIFEGTELGNYNFSWELTATGVYPDDFENESLRGQPIVNTNCPPIININEVELPKCTTLDFDGVNDFVDLGSNYTGNYFIEAWIRPFDRPLANGSGNTNASTGVIFSSSGFEIRMENLPGIAKNGRWYHIAVANNGDLWVDGISSGNIDKSGSGINSTSIGARYNANTKTTSNHFSGWIEEVRIWNNAPDLREIRFMMNQRLKLDASGKVISPLEGEIVPNRAIAGSYLTDGPGNTGNNLHLETDGTLKPFYDQVGSDLAGYYRLISEVPDPDLGIITNLYMPLDGNTPDLSLNGVPGRLYNMTTDQQNTSPTPYFSANPGIWETDATWARPDVWNPPHSGDIEWNIVRINHDINSGDRDITVLGLKSETAGKLLNITRSGTQNEYNPGQMLRVTHYLKLDGNIDLVGESQLIQDGGSILAESSAGWLERDQQGKKNSFVYNYWSSLVSKQGDPNNALYNIKSVLMDGTTASNPKTITFKPGYWEADYGTNDPIIISGYWLWGYSPAPANIYAEWDWIHETGTLETGEGFTMKGTYGDADINDEQNYTFRGKPHNGDFDLTMAPDQNYLIGNPYPSAMDADEFIRNNLLNVVGGNNTTNVFDGALYFWDHFQEVDHILKEYIGGYATYNLSGGVPAISNDDRVNANNAPGSKYPGQYIPVAQAFLINSSDIATLDVSGGAIHFKNSQRIFKREKPVDDSQFLKPEVTTKTNKQKTQENSKIRISFKSPVGYHRQILVGAISFTTNGFDLGYDALLFDDNVEDMYWLQGDNQLVIQGIPNFNKDQVLPLGVKIKENKEFSIKIDALENAPAEMNVYLNDKLKDSIHDLKAGPYLSTSEPGYIHDRFEIIFFKEEPPVIEGPIVGDPVIEGPIIEGPQTDFTTLSVKHAHNLREIQIMNPDKLIITSVYLFDLNGNLIEGYTNIPQNKEIKLRVGNYSSGVYLLKVYAEGKIISKKIIISN